MMKVKVVRKKKAVMPTLRLDVKLLETIGKVAEGSILDNIKRQREADGSPLQRNAPSTRETKRRKGRPLLSLVDQFHRFARGKGRSFAQQIDTHGSRVYIEPATSELRRLSRWVQERGYTGWFGLSAKSGELVRMMIRKWMQSQFAAAAKK